MSTIETAMFVVVLDEEEPRSESEVCQKLMTGLPVNRLAFRVQMQCAPIFFTNWKLLLDG